MEDRYVYYNSFTVGVLRGIARDVGVVAPTTKSKKQVITEIINIENGVQQPQPTILGRKPNKNLKDEHFITKTKSEEFSKNAFIEALKVNVKQVINGLNCILKTLENYDE